MTAAGPPSAVAEGYEALRNAVAYRALARDVVEVQGPEAESYLQGQCSQDIAGLADGCSAEALLLNPDGKLVALLRVSRVTGDRFVLDVDAGFAATVVDRLGRFRLRTKVAIEPLAWKCLALRGPGVPTAAEVYETLGAPGAEAGPGAGVAVVAPGGTGGFEGLDLLGPDPGPAVPDGVLEASAGAWEARRVESGTPRMGLELDGRTIAAEAGLLERAVSFTKGCYTGQELVARLDARGNKVARHLRGLVIEDPAAALAGPGSALMVDGGRTVGSVTSAAFSPALSRVVALGYVHRSVQPGDQVLVGPHGVRAEVVTLPAA